MFAIADVSPSSEGIATSESALLHVEVDKVLNLYYVLETAFKTSEKSMKKYPQVHSRAQRVFTLNGGFVAEIQSLSVA